MQICDHITSVLASGCFPLHKWLFNTCLNTPNESRHLSLGDDCSNKTLGLGWFTQSDELYFTTKLKVNTHTVTKRSMLSVIAQIYDPLGLLSPTIICAKILLQKLWLSKLDWDDPVPHDVVQSWEKFIKSFDCLKDIRIPRHVIGSHNQYIELHIFSDASQSAYGACSYIRSYSDNSPVFIKLLCSKSKTAPLKAISIPRLELCGSLVGAKLFAKINLLPLTPAHFLIGRPLTAPASEDLTTTPSHRLTRYHRIEQLRQHFWQRWSKEYVSELQTRTKWKSPSRDITEDMLVLIKEDNSPPLKWRLGRVTEVSRGKDGVARVAYIRTSEGIIQRACSKICPIFPEDEDPEEEDIGRVLPRPGAC
ncbi:uncharacterized protein LOC128198351 [Bicyclus anynana]|uniref:Uncharacterized protein LOC128198351 n=1 Tax=Bicyclus anynana TaxID=110368 RepID=A0ABM3LJT6_BICAN|nr:uncharacterized protein LOC128198351 [Bicyclus anynana]